jgi:hypothetical protein
MNLCFNEWFVDGELGAAGAVRAFEQRADWVHYVKGAMLSPTAVPAQVNALRSSGKAFIDTVA